MRWPTCHCKPAKVFGSIEFLELIHQITQGWGKKTFLFTVNFPDKLERGNRELKHNLISIHSIPLVIKVVLWAIYVHMIPFCQVRGFSKMVMGKKQYLFSGIPYAKPPVGNRRFDDDKDDDRDDHGGHF